MSADNYYVVRLHPEGGYTYVMGFDSDPEPNLEVRVGDPQYLTLEEAMDAVSKEYAEYGWYLHEELQQARKEEALHDCRTCQVTSQLDGSVTSTLCMPRSLNLGYHIDCPCAACITAREA